MADRTLAGGLALMGDWLLGEDAWKPDMDTNLLRLSLIVQGRVKDYVAATPGAPVEGDVYLFTPAHATQPNNLAAYDNATWKYFTAQVGWRFYDVTALAFRQFDGTAWPTDAVAPAPYTDEKAQDAIAAMLADGGGITPVYDDVGNMESLRASRFLVPFYFVAAPTANEVLALYTATDAFTIPINMAGSKGAVGGNPAAAFTISVARQVNGGGAFAAIGTIVISAAGAITWTTTGGAAISIDVGDIIKFTAQATVEAALVNSTFTVRGQ